MLLTKKYKKRITALEEDLETLEQNVSNVLENSKNQGNTLRYLSEQVPRMLEDVSDLVKAMNELKEKSVKMDEILEDYENFSIEKTLAKKSNEPWAGLSVSEIDKESGRVGLKVDWNDKFQDHLKRSGIPGNTDDERMSIWLTSLIKEWGEEIDEETAKQYREDL